MKTFIQKLKYYNDFRLLSFILGNILTVLFTHKEKRLKLANIVLPKHLKHDNHKTMKYTTFIFFLMKKIGIKLSCYTSSVAVCRIFRKKGIDAKIVFACTFNKKTIEGHCWVETGTPAESSNFKPVFSYPY